MSFYIIGIAFGENGIHIYAVDIAFHEGGLNYGAREETTSRIVKKYIRTIMSIIGYFNVYHGDIVFASPKISPGLYNDILNTLNDINNIITNIGLHYNVEIIANEEFERRILTPVINLAKDVADTSELFI
ncbi:MAG: hypothetical protein ACRC7N_10320 [Clostridium sp.]